MRDLPWIVGLIAFFIAFIIVGGAWYAYDNKEDEMVTSLNEWVRSSAVNHVDLTSRTDVGQVYLDQNGPAKIIADKNVGAADFESAVLTKIAQSAPNDSEVRFDYILANDSSQPVVSIYEYENATWNYKNDTNEVPWTRPSEWRYLKEREPIEVIRVQYRVNDNTATTNDTDVDNPDYWTYQSTVEVNRSDYIENKMN